MSQTYPLPGFRFAITLLGVIPIPNSSFMEAYGFGAQVEMETVGQNTFRYNLPTKTTFTNLVLKQGMLPSNSPLVLWCMETVLFGASIGIVPLPLTLHLINDQGTPAKTWVFMGAYPVKYQTSEFKSTDNSVAVETLEFTYKYFMPITL